MYDGTVEGEGSTYCSTEGKSRPEQGLPMDHDNSFPQPPFPTGKEVGRGRRGVQCGIEPKESSDDKMTLSKNDYDGTKTIPSTVSPIGSLPASSGLLLLDHHTPQCSLIEIYQQVCDCTVHVSVLLRVLERNLHYGYWK